MVDNENYWPPPGYPSSSVISLRPKDLSATRRVSEYFGELGPPGSRVMRGIAESEAFAVWSCREIDSQFHHYLETLIQKPLFLTGPLLRQSRETSPSPEDRKWDEWMNKFPPKTIVYCRFGSEFTPEKDQFMELLLGFELCSRPFIVTTTKPPRGCSTIEESLPVGYAARIEGRGRVHCGWVPQVAILEHESVGCFVSHCRSSSMWEALFSDCRIVLQSVTAMFMAEELKLAVEVENDGWIGKEELSRAIGVAMDEESEMGQSLKRNHDMYRSMLLEEGIQDSYTDDFISKLCALMEV